MLQYPKSVGAGIPGQLPSSEFVLKPYQGGSFAWSMYMFHNEGLCSFFEMMLKIRGGKGTSVDWELLSQTRRCYVMMIAEKGRSTQEREGWMLMIPGVEVPNTI